MVLVILPWEGFAWIIRVDATLDGGAISFSPSHGRDLLVLYVLMLH